MPASPPMSTKLPSPSWAAAHRSLSRAIGASRPTKGRRSIRASNAGNGTLLDASGAAGDRAHPSPSVTRR